MLKSSSLWQQDMKEVYHIAKQKELDEKWKTFSLKPMWPSMLLGIFCRNRVSNIASLI
jgi:hypothetical protein